MGQDKKTPKIGLRLWNSTKDEWNYIKDEGIIYEIILIGTLTFITSCCLYLLWPAGQ